MDSPETPMSEIQPFPATVPGSVLGNLQHQGLVQDLYAGFEARRYEWAENRDWAFRTCVTLPEGETRWRLICPGLDGPGVVIWDNQTIGIFDNSHVGHRFQVPPALSVPGKHELVILFQPPPRWAGQYGHTSTMPVTKTRFYYSWDWTGRVVQTAITGMPYLVSADEPEVGLEECRTELAGDNTGIIRLRGCCRALPRRSRLGMELYDGGERVLLREFSPAEFRTGMTIPFPAPRLWQPNGSGIAHGYRLRLRLNGEVVAERTVGFVRIEWRPCAGAAADAEPWVCVINGVPTFLQGVNWTPIRPLTVELTEADYRCRLERYRKMGVNTLRVWGGASRECDLFYRLCDEYGLLVWQEFPLSSSGLDNRPPCDSRSVAQMRAIAGEYLAELSSHPALLLWSGGNELMVDAARPCRIADSPMLAMLQALVAERDPARRFVATSASGPIEWFERASIGTGRMHDVHGPWKCTGALDDEWEPLWRDGDALFHSEFGCPGAADAALIRRYAAAADLTVNRRNSYLNHPSPLWNESDRFEAEHGRLPESLEEYVAWSQARQSRALHYALAHCKARFPACGGALIWMGHDSFPCACNTSIIDFEGNPKPAADAVAEVFTKGNTSK